MMNLLCTVFKYWKAFHCFPGFKATKAKIDSIQIEHLANERYAGHTRAEQINVNTVASASVGPSVLRIQKQLFVTLADLLLVSRP